MKYRTVFAYLLFVALVYAITLLCSPAFSIYSQYRVNVDQNVYHLIGQYWFQGFIPYADYSDLKGPITYLIYGLCALLSPKSFFALSILHSFLIAIGVLYVYKTLTLFLTKKYAIISLIIYLCCIVSFAGNPSEYVWVMQHIVLYYVLLFLKRENNVFTKHQLLMTGAVVGMAICLKYNLIICFFIHVVLMIWGSSCRWYYAVLWLAIGCVSVLMPFVLYFSCAGALDELWSEYFWTSVQYGGTDISNSALCKKNIILLSCLVPFKYSKIPDMAFVSIGFLIVLLSCLFYFNSKIKKQKIGFAVHLFGFVLTFLLIYIGPYSWGHYAYSLYPFILPAIVAAFLYIENSNKCSKLRNYLAVVSIGLFAVVATKNIYNLYKDSKGEQQIQLQEIASKVESRHLITDGGSNPIIYRLTDTRPPIKYFTAPIIPGGLALHYKEMVTYIKENKPEFVCVTRKSAPYIIPEVEMNGIEYKVVMESSANILYQSN